MTPLFVFYYLSLAVIFFLAFRTTQHNEYLLNKIIRRLEQMATKQELEEKLAEVAAAIDAAFTALTDTLIAEVQQVKDAIANAGTNNAAVIAALDTMESNLKAKSDSLSTGISDIVTPEP